MSELTLYHGSQVVVGKPVFGFGKATNDYGRGFYCTESEDLAKEWACQYNRQGYSNRYCLETDGLKILDLESDEYNAMNWVAVLLNNRRIEFLGEAEEDRVEKIIRMYSVNVEAYDVVSGYRADDSYFMFAEQFISGAISYEKLSAALRLGGFGIQVVLKSKKAFDRIEYIGAEEAYPETYYQRFISREQSATEEYNRLSRKGGSGSSGTFVYDIIEGRMSV